MQVTEREKKKKEGSKGGTVEYIKGKAGEKGSQSPRKRTVARGEKLGHIILEEGTFVVG